MAIICPCEHNAVSLMSSGLQNDGIPCQFFETSNQDEVSGIYKQFPQIVPAPFRPEAFSLRSQHIIYIAGSNLTKWQDFV